MSVLEWSIPGYVPTTSSSLSRQSTLLGRGLSFPLKMDSTVADFQQIDEEANVEQCLHQLIMTMPGERMDPRLGTAVPETPFSESNVLPDIAEPSITFAINQFEPRVRLNNVYVNEQQMDRGVTGYAIRIQYLLRATNTRRGYTVNYEEDKF